MPEQDPTRKEITINLFAEALRRGERVNLSQVNRLAGYLETSNSAWKIYKQLEAQGVPLPEVEKIARAQGRKKRIAEARSGNNPTSFNDLAGELGMSINRAKAIAHKEGVTESILTSEEAEHFRAEVLALWQKGLRLGQMAPQLQELGYKATVGQLNAAFNDLKTSGAITENARNRQQRLREERFIQEILSDKDAAQICEDMDITPRVFEVLELRLRERIQAEMQSEDDLSRIQAKRQQRKELEKAWTAKRKAGQIDDNLSQNGDGVEDELKEEIEASESPDMLNTPIREEVLPEPIQTTPIQPPIQELPESSASQPEESPTTPEQRELLRLRKEQLKNHLANLRQQGGMVIPDGPILVAGSQSMAQFEQLNNMSYALVKFALRGASAIKYKLPNYRVDATKTLTDPIALVNKNYQYDEHAPDESGIQSYLWEQLRLFTEKLLTSTGTDFTDDDVEEVLEAFFVSS